MVFIALALIGFAIIHLCDPAAIKRVPFAKPVAWLTGLGLLIYSGVMASLSGEKFDLPGWTVGLGWALLAASSALIVFSLFVNIPFRKTYVATGIGDRLVTTGFYSLTRHPGVLWTALLVGSLVLVSRSYLVLAAAPVIVTADVLLVAIQDRFFFGRMFPGYEEYRRDTPMLVPNARSIKAFTVWLRQTYVVHCLKGENNDFQPS